MSLASRPIPPTREPRRPASSDTDASWDTLHDLFFQQGEAGTYDGGPASTLTSAELAELLDTEGTGRPMRTPEQRARRLRLAKLVAGLLSMPLAILALAAVQSQPIPATSGPAADAIPTTTSTHAPPAPSRPAVAPPPFALPDGPPTPASASVEARDAPLARAPSVAAPSRETRLSVVETHRDATAAPTSVTRPLLSKEAAVAPAGSATSTDEARQSPLSALGSARPPVPNAPEGTVVPPPDASAKPSTIAFPPLEAISNAAPAESALE